MSEPDQNSLHVILFTGHMIDKPGRSEARFPPAKEINARDAITDALKKMLQTHTKVVGIAGGASGGDILFHEACLNQQIPSRLFLLLGKEEYIKNSVETAGGNWVARFEKLYDILPKSFYHGDVENSHAIWKMNNEWMLNYTISLSGKDFTLMALWDGLPGDGPGGTEHMVEMAKNAGGNIIILNTKKIFAL